MLSDSLSASAAPLADYVSPAELAGHLGISRRTLDRLHALRRGPPRTRIGRKVLYRLDAVREWLRDIERGRSADDRARGGSSRKNPSRFGSPTEQRG